MSWGIFRQRDSETDMHIAPTLDHELSINHICSSECECNPTPKKLGKMTFWEHHDPEWPGALEQENVQ